MAKPKKTEYTIDECYLMMFSEYEDVVTAQEAAGKTVDARVEGRFTVQP